jgi:hypothetical protein
MTHRDALPITMEDLTKDWNRWISDSSLQSTQRFGQYFINKHLRRGYVWPDCYYADTKNAWEMLFQWINNPSPTTYPKLAYQ